ncbi:conserved hypothetical protein [Histoplasma capsulatum G186AR]|uniref:Uncharacterized protein n=2 Tax=Ajellomyces capsulatus TaxID=5037 RepID=C0NS66_AJECG|nr:uncharacterized protein HCBG_05996 [Histoplasma capsulatum G186AR]EEH05732.1 conserved hypothetical protein [Histoplasma capsulatum G186AR]KAG5300111.1 hypothetical protein I7I52_10649 [Histoplasma capsulatum]QSS67260.1 hypothetical protein I7I50_06278 [Histoplasma capsulatum G186AR]
MDGEEQKRTHTRKVPEELDLERSTDYVCSVNDSPGTATSSQPLIEHDKLESPPFTPDSPPGRCYKLTRYYTRTLAGILMPLVVTGFWVFISLNLLRKRDIVNYGSENEILIYYAWFIIAVFGLGLSKYGLEGVEVAMLQHPFWQAGNAMVILMHSSGSWAGPNGWLGSISRLLAGRHPGTHRLWNLLAFISILGSIAIPLSGICMQLGDGYVNSDEHPMVSGRTRENFNSRDTGQTAGRGGNAWRTAAPVTVPGMGIIYTPPFVNRDEYPQFASLPNSLPVHGGIPEFFLTPQPTKPINGKAWGLRLRYNCSAVKSASEFTVLARLPQQDTGVRELGGIGKSPSFKGDATIFALKPAPWELSKNIWGYARVGVDLTDVSIYDGSEATSFDEKDLQHANVLEYAMWQMRFSPAYADIIKHPQFDDNLKPTMADIYQPFTLAPNDTRVQIDKSFFGDDEADTLNSIPFKHPISIAEPIGVRCVHISALGTAELDARTSTYTDFKQTLSPPFNESEIESPAPRFGFTAAKILSDEYFQIFNAINSAPPEVVSNSVYYRRYIQPKTLIEAIMRAYAMDALQLMYDGIYSTEEGSSYIAKNLTSSRRGKVLERGKFNPRLPGTLFVIWSVSSAIIGVTYGFRRRWSERLDGYSLFRFGVDLAHEVRPSELSSTSQFEKCTQLKDLPGLIGDSRPDMAIGHITLVAKQNIAKKDKMYC